MRKNIVSIIKDCWGIFYRTVVVIVDKKISTNNKMSFFCIYWVTTFIQFSVALVML